jgi:hypothetical protein
MEAIFRMWLKGALSVAATIAFSATVLAKPTIVITYPSRFEPSSRPIIEQQMLDHGYFYYTWQLLFTPILNRYEGNHPGVRLREGVSQETILRTSFYVPALYNEIKTRFPDTRVILQPALMSTTGGQWSYTSSAVNTPADVMIDFFAYVTPIASLVEPNTVGLRFTPMIVVTTNGKTGRQVIASTSHIDCAAALQPQIPSALVGILSENEDSCPKRIASPRLAPLNIATEELSNWNGKRLPTNVVKSLQPVFARISSALKTATPFDAEAIMRQYGTFFYSPTQYSSPEYQARTVKFAEAEGKLLEQQSDQLIEVLTSKTFVASMQTRMRAEEGTLHRREVTENLAGAAALSASVASVAAGGLAVTPQSMMMMQNASEQNKILEQEMERNLQPLRVCPETSGRIA